MGAENGRQIADFHLVKSTNLNAGSDRGRGARRVSTQDRRAVRATIMDCMPVTLGHAQHCNCFHVIFNHINPILYKQEDRCYEFRYGPAWLSG